MSERFASSKFADFTNVRELYRSQAGAVFRATFKYDNREYVIKERHLSKQGQTKDIMNEVKLLIQLHHPNVIRCEGWFRDDSRKSIFIVLEYCGGGDLSSVIVKRRSGNGYFEEREIWYIFNQLCEGLKHLHEHGIIHRDLKPLNIMCTASGKTFKLGDLGVSRQVSEETLMLKSFYGTPLYLSPELVENRLYNEKTDIWSLGVILYELCCLQPPFKGNSLLDVARMVSEGKYAPISRRYSKYLSGCIAWMLNLDFTKRPNVLQVLAFVHKRLSSGKSSDHDKAPADPVNLNASHLRVDRNRASQVGMNMHNNEEEEEDCRSDGTDDTRMDDDSLDGKDVEKEKLHRSSNKNRGVRTSPDNNIDRKVIAVPSQPVHRRSAASSSPAKKRHVSNNKSNSTGKRGGGEGSVGSGSGSENDSDGTVSDREVPAANNKVMAPEPIALPSRRHDTNNIPYVPSAPQQLDFPVPVPRCEPPPQHRQSLQELRHEKVERKQRQVRSSTKGNHLEEAGGVDPKVVKRMEIEEKVVVVDVQRLQVLLRREASKLRQLLQARDFAALKTHSSSNIPNHHDGDCGGEGNLETPAEAIQMGIKSAQNNVKVLDAALAAAGTMIASDAERFGFRIGPLEPAMASEQALPQPESISMKQQKNDLAYAVVVPVTALPLRPGEDDPLGLDINADRTNFCNSSGQEYGHGVAVGKDVKVRRPLDKARDDRPQLRQSPERKQVSNQFAFQLQYHEVQNTSDVHINARGAQAGDRAQLFHQRKNHPEEDAVRKVRPTSAAALGRGQLSQHEAAGQHDATRERQAVPRRPGTAGANRASRHVAAAAPADRNAERKNELLLKWGATGDNENALAGGGNLALPSVQKMAQFRPRMAMPSANAAAEENASFQRPRTTAVEARRANNTEQFTDIMFNNVLRKQKVHRRVKSDVTTPDYVLPTHSGGDERRPNVEKTNNFPSHSKEHHHAVEPKRNSAANVPLSEGLQSKMRQQPHEIVLRGAGHHGDGELLPNQRRVQRDTAQNIISGQI